MRYEPNTGNNECELPIIFAVDTNDSRAIVNFFFFISVGEVCNERKIASCVSKCRIVCPRSPDAALTSRGRGEVNWYKASFKLYRFTRKRKLPIHPGKSYDE